MQTTATRSLRFLLSVTAGLALAASAHAQPAAAAASADAKAQQEREACLSGRSGQDREACLREVGAARDAGRRGQLDTAQEQLDRNRTDRCKSLTGADQADCLARMRGQGTSQGSVKGGGILREKVTIVPAAGGAAAAASAGAASALQGIGAMPSSSAAPASGNRSGSATSVAPAASAGAK